MLTDRVTWALSRGFHVAYVSPSVLVGFQGLECACPLSLDLLVCMTCGTCEDCCQCLRDL